MLELAKLIDLIVGFASPVVQDKLQRSELVIKLLKQLKLDPDHPPADFTAVYQYTLVEYGIGKPKPVLELFRQAEIQAIFRKALDQNNPSLLLKEGETFLSGHNLGDQIRALGIDARQEFYQFAAVFIEVAKRTRTPAEVLANQRLESLHRQISSIQERLHRLPTLEAMRTEMARLAAQGYPMLPGATATPALVQERQLQEQQCRAFALAQQMKGWFETLGYRFESHEVWQDDYFEWIIDIPVRRGRYDRILVRGVDGEVGLSDIKALRQSVETQRADEGWLVTARRISRAARDEVDKEENHDLGCYTFDELLDQDADFSGYLDWLESEIQRRGIDQKYVPLACTKEEIDPDTKQRIGLSRYDDRDGWIDGYIDLWLDDPAKEHISVLGEFGTGKTWFAFHYASQALKRYREAQQRGVERPRLPLVIPLRDYAKAVSVESLFSEFFFRKHEVRSLTYSAFEQLNRMGKLLLIFDGFDEMAARVDRQEMINNFWELAKVVVPGAKVILTCRTEHFPEAREGRALLNAQLQASTANLTGEMPQFEVLELEKFNDEQIRQVMSQQAEAATVEQVMSNPQLLDLARRPVMTELILEALPDIEAGKPVDMSRVYLYAVRRKMERDIREERTFTSLADKLYFLCELSWEMLSSDRMSLNYREFPDRIRRLFGSVVQEEKDLDHWHYDMMGQTMLIRNADGDYMPAHRSLLEFFVAYKFAAELGALAPDFLELARLQTNLDIGINSKSYTWSSYFQRQIDSRNQTIPMHPLERFVQEPIEVLHSTFGRFSLTKALTDLLIPMLETYNLSANHPLLLSIEATRDKAAETVGYVGGNSAELLVKVDRTAFENKDLSYTILRGADFSNASLRNANFTGVNLVDSIFSKTFSGVLSIAISVDGQILATADSKGNFHVWKAESGTEVLTVKAHSSAIRSVTFSPNGLVIATSGSDLTLKLWSAINGELLEIFSLPGTGAYSVSFSPDGQTLVGGCDDGLVRLWNLTDNKLLATFQGHTGRIRSVAFSPSGELLATGSDDQTIRLWKVQNGQCIKTFQGNIAIFNLDGDRLAGIYGQKLMLWDLNTGECLKVFEGHTRTIFSLAFSQNGEMLASGSGDETVRLWNTKTGNCVRVLREHNRMVRSVIFSPNRNTLISGSADATVKLWDVYTGECLRTLQSNSRMIFSASSRPKDRGTVVSGSSDYTVRLWDVNTGKCLKILQGHKGSVNSVAFAPSGEMLASGSADATVKLWDFTSGKCLKTLYGHFQSIRSIAFSPSGGMIASGSADSTIRLWSISTSTCFRILSSNTEEGVNSVVFHPNGKTLAASRSQSIELWDIDTGNCLKVLQGHTGRKVSIAFSPNGELIASAGDDLSVRLWHTNTNNCIRVFQPQAEPLSVNINSTGNIVATGDSVGTIQLWDINTGQCFKTLREHTTVVWSVSFYANDQILISGSWDGTIKVWDIETGNCLRTLIDRPYGGMNITGVKGVTEAEKASLKALGAIEA